MVAVDGIKDGGATPRGGTAFWPPFDKTSTYLDLTLKRPLPIPCCCKEYELLPRDPSVASFDLSSISVGGATGPLSS